MPVLLYSFFQNLEKSQLFPTIFLMKIIKKVQLWSWSTGTILPKVKKVPFICRPLWYGLIWYLRLLFIGQKRPHANCCREKSIVNCCVPSLTSKQNFFLKNLLFSLRFDLKMTVYKDFAYGKKCIFFEDVNFFHWQIKRDKAIVACILQKSIK